MTGIAELCLTSGFGGPWHTLMLDLSLPNSVYSLLTHNIKDYLVCSSRICKEHINLCAKNEAYEQEIFSGFHPQDF